MQIIQPSYWEQNSFLEGFDVMIIGSGIVGLNTAIYLKEQRPHLNILVIERGALPLGASSRNAGFACIGSMTELLADRESLSDDSFWKTVESRWKGLLALRARLGDDHIGYEEVGGYELFLGKDEGVYQNCLGNIDYFNQQLKEITGESRVFRNADQRLANWGFNATRLIENKVEGQINTGKMMKSLIAMAREKGVEIINGVEVKSIEEADNFVCLHLANGWAVRTPYTILATNGFTRKFFPQLPLSPARNLVWVSEEIEDIPWEGTFHYHQGYTYFRRIGKRLLIGGFRHIALAEEATEIMEPSENIRQAIHAFVKEVIFPNYNMKPEFEWTGIMGVGPDKSPLLEWVSDRILVGVRLGGMGVAIGTEVGNRLGEKFQERI